MRAVLQTLLALTVPIVMLISRSAVAGGEGGDGTILRVGLELTDGSYLLGLPSVSNMAIKTSYADLQVKLEHISGITVSPNDRTASVEMRNGDRINGTLETPEMRIESLIGNVLIHREQIVALRVVRGVALDAQFMDGLVLHYTFDSADKLAADSGPAGRHGTVHGAKHAANGKRNGAADFDGRTAHIRTPVVDNTKDVTWALWVFPRALVGTDRTVQPLGLKGHAWVWNSCNTCLLFYLDGPDSTWLHFVIQGQVEGAGRIVKTADMVGRWVHIVGIVSSEGRRVYMDGKLFAETRDATRFGSPCAMIIGAHDNGPTRHFDGLIDEVMVFDRALSGDDVNRLYESQK